ncbi:MAG: hypothetical protein U9Q68_05085 [Euryarchaeota archaeon]|nr:hypothetical protein [Euryarchaeota archaeon]
MSTRFREKRLYVDRLIRMSGELAEIFRILKIGVPRYDEFFRIEFSDILTGSGNVV